MTHTTAEMLQRGALEMYHIATTACLLQKNPDDNR